MGPAAEPDPSPFRIALAFLIAPLLPSVILAGQLAWSGINGGFLVMLRVVPIVAYAIDIGFGVPVFFLMRRAARRRLWPLCLANAAITAGGAFAAVNLVAVLDGGLQGLRRPSLHDLLGFGDLALLGALGGAILWSVLTVRRRAAAP